MSTFHNWSKLTSMQLGKYAEYFTKMEFTLHGFDVYSAEVDDKGIDFVIRKNEDKYYDVQVKSVRNFTYAFIPKSKCTPRKSMLIAYLQFNDGELPTLYLIPTTVWNHPNSLFTSYDYIGKKSPPEWGISISKNNLALLEEYIFETTVKTL